jgi:ABC-type sugar transport system substrate-binding protein/AraC-like DNA-binding protein
MNDSDLNPNIYNTKSPILWVTEEKPIPPRPEDPLTYPEEHYNHWYDQEYAGWGEKKVNMPASPGNGPRGKNVTCLLPGHHPYFASYERGMIEAASAFKINLKFKYSEWDDQEQQRQVEETIKERPDMCILVPDSTEYSSEWYKEINMAGIPVIGSNLIPESDAFKYILTWTGPDDWAQCRKLAGEFAKKMNYTGAYVILGHFPGCSAYCSRKWGVITELKRIAPKMKFLDAEPSHFDPDSSYQQVLKWLSKYGDELKGIYSADISVQTGINKAINEFDRKDIICVATAGSGSGLRLLKEDNIDAIVFQAPEIDGALPIQVAIDWFNGLRISPFRYLPVQVLTKENVDEYVFNFNNPGEVNLDYLYQLIIDGNNQAVEIFYDSIFNQFSTMGVLTIEYFRGFSIELLSGLLQIIKSYNLKEKNIIGDYETIFKKLFNQQTMKKTLLWLKIVSFSIIAGIKKSRSKPPTLIEQIVEYVNINYQEPISLKTISYTFNNSAAYLGRLFKEQTGESFSKYLNKMRIEKAKELMSSSSEKANKIAIQVGYSDPNYFYITFKKYTGLYPSEYLESLIN